MGLPVCVRTLCTMLFHSRNPHEAPILFRSFSRPLASPRGGHAKILIQSGDISSIIPLKPDEVEISSREIRFATRAVFCRFRQDYGAYPVGIEVRLNADFSRSYLVRAVCTRPFTVLIPNSSLPSIWRHCNRCFAQDIELLDVSELLNT